MALPLPLPVAPRPGRAGGGAAYGAGEAAVICAVSAVVDGAEQVAGALLSPHAPADVSAVHAALARSEQRYAVLTDSLPQLIWTCLPDGQCHYLSRQWQQYTGMTTTSLLGLGWVDALVHPEDREQVYHHWMGAVRDENAYNIDFRMRRHDGAYRWFVTRGVPVRDAGGRITYWFGTCTDIEDQKAVEVALQESLRARDQFVSVASHELKTPLTSLSLLLERLRRGVARQPTLATDRIAAIAEHGRHQVARLTALVDDMLDATRIRARKLELTCQPVDLAALTTAVLERTGPLFAEAQKSVPTLTLDARPQGQWDSRRIEQILVNLLTNALRYGAGRPVAVRVWIEGDDAMVSVADQGIGVPPECLDKIFARFERAISPTEASGLGLGLLISQEIAQAHGGRITLESTVGAGSTFTLRLPCSGSVAQSP